MRNHSKRWLRRTGALVAFAACLAITGSSLAADTPDVAPVLLAQADTAAHWRSEVAVGARRSYSRAPAAAPTPDMAPNYVQLDSIRLQLHKKYIVLHSCTIAYS